MSKINTATITFHASHNYGSMLQAYALQQVLFSLGVVNEIINLRTPIQRKFYPQPKVNFNLFSIKDIVKSILIIPHIKSLNKKYELFESFLKYDLKLTKEYGEISPDLLNSIDKYDYLISGSDQIWNTICGDFNWAYYLPFAKGNAIAYAPSMGPHGEEQVNIDFYPIIREYLKQYIGISVREEGTAKIINKITGQQPQIHIDPTMLLSKEQWERKIINKPLVKGNYIFLYHPFVNKEIILLGRKMSRLMGIPLVISNFNFRTIVHLFGCKKIYDCGPWEFLNLVKNSSLVLSGSFHAVVFSILFQKPFYALNGDKDNRISEILHKTNLEDRVINSHNVCRVIKKAYEVDFTKSLSILEIEKRRSLEFLKKHLNII